MKSIYRILMEKEIRRVSANLSGSALDLASGKNPSYRKCLPENLELITADLNTGVDFNQPLPFADGQFNVVLFINALYIVKDRRALFAEIKRILMSDGKFIVVSPFISNEMPEPDDFCRLTHQGLEVELKEAGFISINISRFGERFSSAAYLLDPVWYFWPIKFLVYGMTMLLDKFIPNKVRRLHPAPLGYICLAEK